MTSAYTDFDAPQIPVDVYPPQEDSQLLIDALLEADVAAGARVADLCTGSGVVAVAAARAGAKTVAAFDICPNAVTRARQDSLAAGVTVDVHRGSWARAVEFGPFDVVLANPPYVPQGPSDDSVAISPAAGPARAWNAGPDGRMVLDPMCSAAPLLLDEGGTMLIVQSECSDVRRSLRALTAQGMTAEVVAQQLIPFGPVMTARAAWLMSAGLLPRGSRSERIVVIRADAP